MSDLRKEFEALPKIKDKLCTVEYSPMLNQYHAKMINSATSVRFIQGAWMAFQEQQKKIHKINSIGQCAENQLSDACVKWRELAECKQKRIDVIKLFFDDMDHDTRIGDIWPELQELLK